jgi:predicted RNA polymerase sigma factor
MADIMCLTSQLAVRNEIKTNFARNEKAGRKWLKNFLCCHPQISVRTPEGLSLSSVRGFTPKSVAQFFENYKPAMDTIQHNPARL